MYPPAPPAPVAPPPTPAPIPTARPVTIPPAPGSLAWLHIQANKVYTDTGRQVVLRGVNIEHWNWVYAASPSIAYELRAIPIATQAPPVGWGANIIQLAVASGPINRGDATYLGFIDRMVALAKISGAYTLLSYRSSEPNDEQPSMPDAAAQAAIGLLGARYALEPAVLYGLQVEPSGVSWSTLKPVFTSMIDAIRANNARAVVAVPGTQYSRYVHWNLADPIPRGNLIFKVNYYDPASLFDSAYKLTQVSAAYPIILGEFGAGTATSLSDVETLLNLSDALGISWTGWLFHSVGCPCMLTNSANFTTTAYGGLIQTRLQAAAGYIAPPPTPTATPTERPSPTPAPTPTPLPTATPTPTSSATPTPTPLPTATPTPTPTAMPTPTPAPTATATPTPPPTATPTPQLVNLVVGVNSSADDAYAESIAGTWPGYSHTDTGIYAGFPGTNGPVVGGWRWTGLGIPRGAKIIDAWVELNESGWGDNVTTTLTFEKTAAPVPFSSGSTPMNRLANHTAFQTAWTWGGPQSPGAWIRTPALTAGLQELVDSNGATDSVVLLEDGSGVAATQYHAWAAYDGGAAVAAKLHITYSV